jgi:hypothetical protein
MSITVDERKMKGGVFAAIRLEAGAVESRVAGAGEVRHDETKMC